MCYKTITNSIRLMAQDMPDCLLRYTFHGGITKKRHKDIGKAEKKIGTNHICV
ncbi:hypothetical protein HMPREF9419_1343 [Prevotella nigrescens ATCC 33563]|nr:hypothetical protein HMPREF9419_1343 [Prevotella nigrescens ATCC 33563]